jgi:hypothetical protein
MSKPYKIYAAILIPALQELSSKAYQEAVWVHGDTQYYGMTLSFIEAANNLLGDTCLDIALANGDVIYNAAVTESLQILAHTIDTVDENQSESALLEDANMENVRQQAAHALSLVLAADGSESTVEIID